MTFFFFGFWQDRCSMDIDVEDSSFTTIDYGIFAFLLVVSSAIGFYYGFVAKRKQNNTEEYLLGGKEMGLLPISISLIVSWVCMIFDSSPVFFCWYWHNKHCSIFQTHIRYHNAGDTNRNLCIWNSILVVIYRCICCELNFSASNHAFVIQILLFFFCRFR